MARRRLFPTGRTEPDMRQEMENLLDGAFPEIAKGMPTLLRKMRRDDAGKLIPCACVDKVTHEPDKDSYCPFCQGEGYYWEEEWIETYKVQVKSEVGNALKEQMIAPGLQNTPLVVFYTRYSVEVTEDDKIVEVVLDTEGNPVRPYKRKRLYRIGSAIDLRSDNAKLEYWKLDCHEEHNKFLNGDC